MDLTLEQWQKDSSKSEAIIVDVRTEVEREEGFLKKALHIDYYDAPNFIKKLEQLDKNQSYYIYCKSGARGAQACIVFKQLGFKNVFNLEGGYQGFCYEK